MYNVDVRCDNLVRLEYTAKTFNEAVNKAKRYASYDNLIITEIKITLRKEDM